MILLLQLAVLACAEYLAASRGGPRPTYALLYSPFSAVAAATVLFRYILYDSFGRARQVLVTIALVVVAGSTAAAASGAAIPVLRMLDALGVVGTCGFAYSALVAPTPFARAECLRRLENALILPVAASITLLGLWASSALNPVWDAGVYAFEETIGMQLSVLGVRSFNALGPLSAFADAAYSAPALGLVLVAAKQGSTRRETEVLWAAVIVGMLGYVLYFACPVVGPLTAFGPPYPVSLPSLDAIHIGPMTVAAGPPRNGMPSLHAAWALLVWFNAAPLGASWRRPIRVFVGLTFWAIMGLVDTHWATDVVVAVPLAVAVQLAIVTPSEPYRARWRDGALCAAIVAAWLLGLRHPDALVALPVPLAWTLVVATVAAPLYRQRVVYGPRATDGVADRSIGRERAAVSEDRARTIPGAA
jgi:hypothetical protein